MVIAAPTDYQPIVKAFCCANQVRNNRLALDFFGSGGDGFQRFANFAAFLAIIQLLNRLVLQIWVGRLISFSCVIRSFVLLSWSFFKKV